VVSLRLDFFGRNTLLKKIISYKYRMSDTSKATPSACGAVPAKFLSSYIQLKVKESQLKNRLTAEEIRQKNREYRRKHYAEGKANGAPFYCETLVKHRCYYWKKLQQSLTPVEFMTRLAKLKLRSETKYKDVCEQLNI